VAPDPIDRRGFLALSGGALLCTIAGQEVATDEGKIDVEGLSRQVKVPPKLTAAEWRGEYPGARRLASLPSGGQTREYWIAAEPVQWDIVPTHRDQMMAQKVKGKSKFGAYGYRLYSAGFKSPLGKTTVPGPLIEAEVGDTVVVHFRNKLQAPVTMHPHGIFYANEMDGAYKGKWTDPGGFVQRNRTFTYVWEAHEGTEGTWLYHDHGHTFHLHGHRWSEPDGRIVDNRTFGPADSFSFEIVENNPGRWFYHCHVFQHLHQGMNGWYLVS
jgi:manganese oxidase